MKTEVHSLCHRTTAFLTLRQGWQLVMKMQLNSVFIAAWQPASAGWK